MKNKSSKIVWVFGGSGAGKETFISYVRDNNPVDLLKRIGLSDAPVLVCDESLKWVAQHKGDPRGPKRKALLDVIPQYIDRYPNSNILVKGQDLDLEDDRIRKLKKILPKLDHEIIYIDTDIREQLERWKSSKEWYRDSFTLDTVDEWQRHQLKMLADLKSEFKIIAIHGGKGMNYAPASLPRDLLG